jgi:predicted branched-subunit amino acid permease
MTRLFRPNGTALLSLVAALLIATWPFFGLFTLASLIAGIVMSLLMRSWHDEHPATVAVPDTRPHSEINLASIPVRGDAGGLFFAVGSVAILLALPQLRWFLIASVVCAVAAGYALIAWRHARGVHSSERTARVLL